MIEHLLHLSQLNMMLDKPIDHAIPYSLISVYFAMCCIVLLRYAANALTYILTGTLENLNCFPIEIYYFELLILQ